MQNAVFTYAVADQAESKYDDDAHSRWINDTEELQNEKERKELRN